MITYLNLFTTIYHMDPDVKDLDVNKNPSNNQRRVLLPADFARDRSEDAPLDKVIVAEVSQFYGDYPDTYTASELIAIAYRLLRKADARLNEQIAEKRVPQIEGDKEPEEYSDMLFQAQELTAELSFDLTPPKEDPDEYSKTTEEPRSEV